MLDALLGVQAGHREDTEMGTARLAGPELDLPGVHPDRVAPDPPSVEPELEQLGARPGLADGQERVALRRQVAVDGRCPLVAQLDVALVEHRHELQPRQEVLEEDEVGTVAPVVAHHHLEAALEERQGMHHIVEDRVKTSVPGKVQAAQQRDRVAGERPQEGGRRALHPSPSGPRQVEPVGSREQTVALHFRMHRPIRARSAREDVDLVAQIDQPGNLVEDERLADHGEPADDERYAHAGSPRCSPGWSALVDRMEATLPEDRLRGY